MSTPPFRVKAIYEYSSEHDDDLSFPNGQVILVTEEEDADWYYGEYEDDTGGKHKGLFPRNFVKAYEPETPPRPSRTSRSKKDLEPIRVTNESDEKGPPPHLLDSEKVPKQGPRETEEPAPGALPSVAETGKGSDVSAPAPSVNVANKSSNSNTAKPGPPPVSEKPVVGSFRDRINAFNKPAAPPVAPVKPGALGSNFIRKPFVAPPPSKNAYVHLPPGAPPQKPYRREEDPEITGESSHVPVAEQSAVPFRVTDAVEEEDIPKPTSLKDRIALLQKQQMEQANRHTEATIKKEKQQRPPKKRAESRDQTVTHEDQAANDGLERLNSGDASSKLSMDISGDELSTRELPDVKRQKSREETPLASPVIAPPREFLSDANDADQSGAGETEDGEELSTGRDDSDEKPRKKVITAPRKNTQTSNLGADSGDEKPDEEGEEEEEELDPEVKRRMEIRERMAKMSGGMGMAGMFGPVGGVQQIPTKKQSSVPSERKPSGTSVSATTDPLASRGPPMPMMPMPGMQRVRTPEQEEQDTVELRKPETSAGHRSHAILAERDPEETRDIEDLTREPLPPSRRSTERTIPPPVPHYDVPLRSPTNARDAPPSPFDRPTPPPRVHSQPLSPPPTYVMSPSDDLESDDELSLPAGSQQLKSPEAENSRPTSHDGPAPVHSNIPPIPSRTRGSQSYLHDDDPPSPHAEPSPTMSLPPQSPVTRSSRVPPIPMSSPAIPSAPQIRAPPPPPPTGLPSPKISTGDSKPVSQVPRSPRLQESEEEITAYEGDYDTDIPPSATRKEALRSHARAPGLEDDTRADESVLHHSALPSLGPPISAVPRAAPPPPPSYPPRNARQSSDMPRAPPPPPPPSKEQAPETANTSLEPYSQTVPRTERSANSRNNSFEGPSTRIEHEPKNIYATSSPRRELPPTPQQTAPPYNQASSIPPPSRPIPKQSLEVQRPNFGGRRSMDNARLSSEQGFIAGDIDLGQDSKWWTESNSVPPVLRNRQDLIYELEETSTTRRGGKQAMAKTLYILYMDYSQTVISAHFETRDPGAATLEQRHEPPPSRLRQDQLEDAHTKFGSILGNEATSKKDNVVGDGTPPALVSELISSLPDALPPVGIRAYGALIYANLANASIQQFDEIRPGDVITFRSAKFQGHHGGLVKSKYVTEIGKPDHVGIVVDWDGTKQKVRAWEQGREGRKVRTESFKLGDLRSGEVKVWRVMARNWVGWESQS